MDNETRVRVVTARAMGEESELVRQLIKGHGVIVKADENSNGMEALLRVAEILGSEHCALLCPSASYAKSVLTTFAGKENTTNLHVVADDLKTTGYAFYGRKHVLVYAYELFARKPHGFFCAISYPTIEWDWDAATQQSRGKKRRNRKRGKKH